MYLSVAWLEDYLTKPINVDGLAELLTLRAAEVDSVVKQSELIDKVVVGEVTELEEHPDADKLKVAKVLIKKGKSQTIVCGAPNIAVGQKVAVALPGATLPGMKIEKREVRGVLSEGMCASEKELGLGEGHEGIIVLPDSAPVGQSVAKLYGMNDTVVEIDNKSITNRPDLFSHVGFAREIATLTDANLKKWKTTPIKPGKGALSVDVKDTDFCQRYMAIRISGVKVGPSPEWLQQRLRAIGQNPINNVVDVTNYVMFELGQPLHAFDAREVGNKIVVRNARLDESLQLLDGTKGALTQDMYVIASTKKALAVAGVIGGEASGVNNQTVDIVIESANFDPVSVRKTARKLGVRTESQTRFEKGPSSKLPEVALARAVELVLEHAGGKVDSKVVDAYKKPAPRKAIPFSGKDVERILGVKIPKTTDYLKNLGFIVKEKTVSAPWWRMDISLTEDIVEEVGRIFGLENIPEQPIVAGLRPVQPVAELYWERDLAYTLKGLGWSEAYRYSFYGVDVARKAGLDDKKHVEIENPLSKDLALLRQTLLPNLLSALEKNQHDHQDLQFFERGHVYTKNEEPQYIAGVMLGDPSAVQTVKGTIDELCTVLGVDYSWRKGSKAKLVSGESVLNLWVGGESIGSIGLIDSSIQQAFGVDHTVAAFEINWTKLTASASRDHLYVPIPEYPAIHIDLAVVLADSVPWVDIEGTVRKASKNITEIKVFDVYQGKQIPKGKKSVAFSIAIQDPKKTLTMEDATPVISSVEAALKSAFKGEIRKS